jgi:hypothetical protein
MKNPQQEILNSKQNEEPRRKQRGVEARHGNDSDSVTPECSSRGSRSGLAWIPA